MIQRASTRRFALEARQPIGIGANACGSTLIATSRPSLLSRARYTSPTPHPLPTPKIHPKPGAREAPPPIFPHRARPSASGAPLSPFRGLGSERAAPAPRAVVMITGANFREKRHAAGDRLGAQPRALVNPRDLLPALRRHVICRR